MLHWVLGVAMALLLHCNILLMSSSFLNKTVCPSSIWKEKKTRMVMVFMLKYFFFKALCFLSMCVREQWFAITWGNTAKTLLWVFVFPLPIKAYLRSSTTTKTPQFSGMLGGREHGDGDMGETPRSMDVSEKCLFGQLEILGGLRLSSRGARPLQWTQQTPGSISEGFARILFGCTILM